ncbi:MAG: hypothetical protein JO057_12775 [Chloroflexi bacterium]|nr:hypothetical protein [Chloroflexota bacterium]
MRVWVEDLRFHFAMALRAVGIGVVVVAWVSALSSEAQQGSDPRAYFEVAAVVVSVLIVQLLTQLPPSARVAELLAPMQRDITAVARERAHGDAQLQTEYATAITTLATERIRAGANIPRDRRRWLRTLSDLADTHQT